MLYMFILLLGVVTGLAAVASNPSPYFAALGLVVVSGMGCGVLAGHGGAFLSLILFLIYLGGMLVVFAYCAALAAEPYPESWGSAPVVGLLAGYVVGTGAAAALFSGGWFGGSWVFSDEVGEMAPLRGDVAGVAMVYLGGGGMLITAGGVLLLTLFVVLELTRGLSRGGLRAI